jgi:hypothetical protein
MTKFKISTTINKPADIVAKALDAPENFPYWQTNLERFEIIEGGPNEVGSLARLHYSQKGRSYIMEDTLIYCEPGKKYVSRVTGDALTAEVVTTLRPIGNETQMSLEWSGRGKMFLLRLLLPFLRGRMAKQGKQELETFRQLVETRGFDFSKPPSK